MYYTQIRANAVASALTGGLDGIVTYTATPGQTGFPDLPDGPCLPVALDPRTLPLRSSRPATSPSAPAAASSTRQQFASYGLNFDLLPNYPDEFVNPRSQVVSIGAEREVMRGLFAGADYVHQHWTNLDRTRRPERADRRSIAPPPARRGPSPPPTPTRPIVPVNGGVRSVNVLMNLGVADYDGLQTQISYRGNPKMYANAQLHAVEGDQHHRAGRQRHRAERGATSSRLGEQERGPSVVDQRHRAVISFCYHLPLNLTAGTVTQLASARPFNCHDRHRQQRRRRQQRPAGRRRQRHRKSAFRGTGTQDVSVFVEERLKVGRTRHPAAGWRASTSSTTATSSGARRRSTATPRRSTRPSARSSRWARRRMRCRRWRTSTRRGCCSSRCDSCSKAALPLPSPPATMTP